MLPTNRRRAVLAVVTSAALALAGALVAAPAAQAAATPGGGLFGVDTSVKVDWSTVPAGAQFAYVQAASSSTAGTSKVNPNFYANWSGATRAGIPRGAYFYATPNKSAANGATQATYFYNLVSGINTGNGGTLRPALDIEHDAKGACWGLSAAQTQNWLGNLAATYRSLNGGVAPVIYTSKSYWQNCVGASTQLRNFPLWIVDTGSAKTASLGFGGWTTSLMRQYQLDVNGGQWDYDEFHGSLAGLKSFSSPRFAGSDRWGTGLTAALAFPSGVDTVFAANGANYPDALAAGAAAGKRGGPVLLVPPTGSLPASVKTALAYLKPKHIVVVGGTSAVSNGILGGLRAYSASVTRTSGADRSATSAAIATSNFTKGVANAYIALGTGWPDALSGSSLAASPKGAGPMLLVNQNAIPASVAKALSTLRPQHIYVLGGTAVVSSAVQAKLRAYTASGSASAVTRLAGSDRWGTSVAIAKQLAAKAGKSGQIFAASGATFPDALVGAPVAALSSSPLLLVPPTGALPASVRGEIGALNPSKLSIMGGTAAVSTSVQAALAKAVG